MIYWPAKRPGAVLDYKFDWAGDLAAGVNITGAVVTASGVTVGAVSHDTNSVSVTLSAGILGTPGIVLCSITTDSPSAPTDEETAILPIGEEPVSLDMAERQLRLKGMTIDADDEAHILELIQAAREYAEVYCGIRVVPAALEMTFADFCSLERLTQAPVQSIVDVRYLDASGVEQVLDPSIYEFGNIDSDVLRPRIRLAFNKSWPAARVCDDAVRVNATVGFVAAPRPVIRAILALVTQWYDIRQPVQVDARGVPTEIPNTVTALLTNFRR